MTGTTLIWFAVALGTILCVMLLGVLALIELLPRARGEETVARVQPPRVTSNPANVRPATPAGPRAAAQAPVTRARMSPPAAAPDGGLRRTNQLVAPKPFTAKPGPAASAPAPRAAAAPPVSHYNLDFQEDNDLATVTASRGEFGDDDDLEDSPTVTISRSEMEASPGDFAISDRD